MYKFGIKNIVVGYQAFVRQSSNTSS